MPLPTKVVALAVVLAGGGTAAYLAQPGQPPSPPAPYYQFTPGYTQEVFFNNASFVRITNLERVRWSPLHRVRNGTLGTLTGDGRIVSQITLHNRTTGGNCYNWSVPGNPSLFQPRMGAHLPRGLWRIEVFRCRPGTGPIVPTTSELRIR